MSANYFAGIEAGSAPRLDLASLIDMSFLMLIFFMVSATLQRQEADLGLRLPGVSGSTAHSVRAERMVVTVDDREEIYANRDRLMGQTPDERLDLLVDRLRRFVALSAHAGQPPQVIIDCSGKAREQLFVDVLGACRKSGVRNISLLE